MAQIIKHRRGGVTQLKDVTARVGELVMATGSINDLNGPFLFIGETEGVQGAYRAASKIYQGSSAPTLTLGSHGSVLDGTPFYASGNESLYILSQAGNTRLDLSGNIEDRIISNVTINQLSGSTKVIGNVNVTNNLAVTGSTTLNGSVTVTGLTNNRLVIVGSGGLLEDDGNLTFNGTELNVGQGNFTVQQGSGNIDTAGTLNVGGATTLESTLNVTGSANFKNNVIVSGTTTISGNTYVEYLTDNRVLLAGPNGHIEDNGDLTFDGTKLDIGQGQFQVDVATGDIRTSGSIVMKGNITVGDSNTDNVVLAAEISSSLIPDVHNAFDLGSSDKNWRNLHVSGTAFVNVLNAQTISLSGITVFDDLVVQGSSYLGNDAGDNVNITGSVNINGLTDTYVLFAGPNGQITDNPTFTFNSGTGYLEAPIIRATNDGNGTNFLVGNDMWIGDINQANTMIFQGQEDNREMKVILNGYSNNNYLQASYDNVNLSANDHLNLQSQNGSVYLDAYDGHIYLSNDTGGDINLDGNTYLNTDKTMYVSRMRDNSDDSNMLELYGPGTDDGYWWESGNNSDTTLYNWMNGSNTNILQMDSGNVNIVAHQGSVNLSSNNGFNVTGNTSVFGTTTVNGATTINNNLTVTGNTNITGSATISGATQLLTTLNVDGQSTLASANVENLTNNRVVIVGINGQLEDDNNFTFDGSQLSVGAGNFTVQQSSGNIDTQGTLNVGGATTLESTLDVTGSANFKNNVIVSGTTTISGNTYVQYLVQNRVLLAGANGHIEDNNNLVFDTAKLQVGMGKFEVDVADGDIRTSGSLTVQNGMTINGNETINGNLTVTGNTFINSNLYVSGNVEFLSSASYVHISASVVELDDNIIRLNAYSPFERYAGFEVIDSGSSGVSASLVWDSLNDYWMFVSSSGQSSKLIGTTAGTYGSEISLTTNTIPKGTGANTIGNSLLTDNATTLAYNTNKFTVASSNGATLIAGNVTLSAAGGTDAGSNSSAIVFRDSSNILGYISTTISTVETNGLLGYRQSNGALVFSDLIDGGSY